MRCLIPRSAPMPAASRSGLRENLQAFYDHPVEDWRRLYTTNPIESLIATVRSHTVTRRDYLSPKTGFTMTLQLALAA